MQMTVCLIKAAGFFHWPYRRHNCRIPRCQDGWILQKRDGLKCREAVRWKRFLLHSIALQLQWALPLDSNKAQETSILKVGRTKARTDRRHQRLPVFALGIRGSDSKTKWKLVKRFCGVRYITVRYITRYITTTIATIDDRLEHHNGHHLCPPTRNYADLKKKTWSGVTV